MGRAAPLRDPSEVALRGGQTGPGPFPEMHAGPAERDRVTPIPSWPHPTLVFIRHRVLKNRPLTLQLCQKTGAELWVFGGKWLPGPTSAPRAGRRALSPSPGVKEAEKGRGGQRRAIDAGESEAARLGGLAEAREHL